MLLLFIINYRYFRAVLKLLCINENSVLTLTVRTGFFFEPLTLILYAEHEFIGDIDGVTNGYCADWAKKFL